MEIILDYQDRSAVKLKDLKVGTRVFPDWDYADEEDDGMLYVDTKCPSYDYFGWTDSQAAREVSSKEREKLWYIAELYLHNKTFVISTTPPASKSNPVPSTTLKDSKMKKILDTNKTMATAAAVTETARIVNKKATALLAKSAPIMVRGYIDTPIGRLVSANLVSIAIDNLRPNDTRLKKLSDAMIATAYQELYQEFDIEGMLDKLTAGINLDKLGV